MEENSKGGYTNKHTQSVSGCDSRTLNFSLALVFRTFCYIILWLFNFLCICLVATFFSLHSTRQKLTFASVALRSATSSACTAVSQREANGSTSLTSSVYNLYIFCEDIEVANGARLWRERWTNHVGFVRAFITQTKNWSNFTYDAKTDVIDWLTNVLTDGRITVHFKHNTIQVQYSLSTT